MESGTSLEEGVIWQKKKLWSSRCWNVGAHKTLLDQSFEDNKRGRCGGIPYMTQWCKNAMSDTIQNLQNWERGFVKQHSSLRECASGRLCFVHRWRQFNEESYKHNGSCLMCSGAKCTLKTPKKNCSFSWSACLLWESSATALGAVTLGNKVHEYIRDYLEKHIVRLL